MTRRHCRAYARHSGLTLFALLGYRYVLSAGGRFVGWDILGSFVANNYGRDREDSIASASTHFRKFGALLRPLRTPPAACRGTISDRRVYICTGSPKPWAFLVLVRMGAQMHGVLVPIMEDPGSAARFMDFLQNPAPRIEVQLAIFERGGWQASPTTSWIDWPAEAYP